MKEFLSAVWEVNFADILKYTQRILIDATSGTINGESQNELHRLCEMLEKKDLPYLCNKLKI